MDYAIFAATLFLLLSAMTALRPGRRGVLKIFAFPVGWAAGELAFQAFLAQCALMGLLAWWGWPGPVWIRDASVTGACLVVLSNAVLVGILFRSRVVVARAMRSGPVAPLTLSQPADDQFGRWWRTLLQISLHPRGMRNARDIAYGTDPLQKLDVWRGPSDGHGAPVIFFIHGGAWFFGDKVEQGRPMLHEFVQRGWVAVTVNYRLAPRHAWPAQMCDVVAALAWVGAHIEDFGGDPNRIIVAGASAGGHLAALLVLCGDDPSWGAKQGQLPSVLGCISQYGVLEMTGDDEVWHGHGDELRRLLERRVVQRPLVENESLYRAMSPLERVTRDAPPFLVVQGANDTLVDVNVARSFVTRFRSTARVPLYYVELPFTQHAFDLTASPRTSAVTRAAVRFAESLVGSSVAPTPSARKE